MLNNVGRMVIVVAVITAVGCGDRNAQRSEALTGPSALPTASTGVLGDVNGAPARWGLAGGSTLKQALVGPAIAGIVPEGQAVADMSQFQAGGSTILTVQIRKVNLPDSTVVAVSLSFTPIGSITLVRGEGTFTTDLGHFGVSRDPVEVRNGTTTVLRGGYFQ